MIFTLAQYAFTAALRDKIILSFLALVAVGISLSIFLGQASVVEQAAFSSVFAASTLRLAVIFTLILFICFYLQNAFAHKDVEFLLSRPISRPTFILGHGLAFSLLAFILGGIVCIAMVLLSIQSLTQGTFLWCFSIMIEVLIMANAVLFFAMALKSVTVSALLSVLFYILCRLSGQVLSIVQTGAPYNSVMAIVEKTMMAITVFLPRFDMMGQSSWLVYGEETEIGFSFLLIQCVTFSALFLLAAILDFRKRQF